MLNILNKILIHLIFCAHTCLDLQAIKCHNHCPCKTCENPVHSWVKQPWWKEPKIIRRLSSFPFIKAPEFYRHLIRTNCNPHHQLSKPVKLETEWGKGCGVLPFACTRHALLHADGVSPILTDSNTEFIGEGTAITQLAAFWLTLTTSWAPIGLCSIGNEDLCCSVYWGGWGKHSFAAFLPWHHVLAWGHGSVAVRHFPQFCESEKC